MKFTEHFGLILPQSDLDFIDGLIEKDIPLYIDPAQIQNQEAEWFKESSKIIDSFFETIFLLYREGKKGEAEELLINANEPNETRLGVSSDAPRGRGSSPEKLAQIFSDIYEQGLLEEEFIADYKDLNIFVKDFAEDRMSDLITNIIREKLAEFTVEQASKYGLPLTEPINIGVAWDSDKSIWKTVEKQSLVINGELVLLVPKVIVVKKYLYSIGEYLSKVVYDWRKDHHLENDTSLVKRRFIKGQNKYVPFPPTIEEIIENEIRGNNLTYKEYAVNMTRDNPSLISKFRERISYTYRGTRSNSLTDDEILEVVNSRNI